MLPVALGDRTPVRHQIGLALHHDHVRVRAHHVQQHVQLGDRQLPGGVGDQQHGVRAGGSRDRGGTADTGDLVGARSVHQHQPGAEQGTRHPDLDVRRTAARPTPDHAGHARGDLVERHRSPLHGHRGGAAGGTTRCWWRGLSHRGGRGFGVLHHGRQDCRAAVAHRAGGGVDDRVDQLTLALVRLTDDQDPKRRVQQLGTLLPHRLEQVTTTMSTARTGDLVQHVQPDPGHHRTKCADFGSIIKRDRMWNRRGPDRPKRPGLPLLPEIPVRAGRR